jgi:hypothetical protein
MKKERQGILQNEMLTYERSERFIFQRVSILFSETPCLSAEGKFLYREALCKYTKKYPSVL